MVRLIDDLLGVTRLTGLGPLKSVYFIRWSVLTSLPYNGPPQVRERPPRPLLLWETVYSAPTEPYVETFIHAVGDNVRRIWRTSHGFPGTGSVTDLAGYIGGLVLGAIGGSVIGFTLTGPNEPADESG